MKDEKEVQDELDNLRPTYKDIQQINKLMDETKSDDKMQNSQFMQFLQNMRNRPPIADQYDQFDQSQLWGEEFQVFHLHIFTVFASNKYLTYSIYLKRRVGTMQMI